MVNLFERCHELFYVEGGRLIRKRHAAPNARAGDVAGWFDNGYYRVRVDKVPYLVHRIIYLMTYGYLPEIVDHINGDTTNNVVTNLRAATKMQNRWNCRGNLDSFSGVKGVYKDGNKWKALVTIDGQQHYLGMFSDKTEAEKVVDEKYRELHGHFYYNPNYA